MPGSNFMVGERVRGDVSGRLGTIARVIDNERVRVQWDTGDGDVSELSSMLSRINEAAPIPPLSSPPTFAVGDRVRVNPVVSGNNPYWTNIGIVCEPCTPTTVTVSWGDPRGYVERGVRIDRILHVDAPNARASASRPLVVGDRVELIPGDSRNNSTWTYAGTLTNVYTSGYGEVVWDGQPGPSPHMDLSRLRRSSRPAPPPLPPTPRRLESQPRIGTRVQRASAGGTWRQGRVTEHCGNYAVHVAWDRLGPFSECNDWNNLCAVERVRRPQVRREGPRPPKVKKPCTHGGGVLTTASGKIKCGSCGVDVSPSVSVTAR